MRKMLPRIVWSVEHVLGGNRFLDELGGVWYLFWIRTPIEANHSLCVFCRKDGSGGRINDRQED